jgi:aminoglycoside phosphotransferase (APT) family kinase protein
MIDQQVAANSAPESKFPLTDPAKTISNRTGPDLGVDAIARALVHMGLVSAHSPPRLIPLTGGVSSDVYRADLPSGAVCVKRALPKLKVAADWRAPVERNRWEVEWMRIAATIVPAAVPRILGEDRERGCFAMAFLPPDRYPVWKAQLLAGVIDATTAARVGDALGRIHSATADRRDIAARFPTDDIFYAIRLEPYLVATARSHPDLAMRLDALVDATRGTKRVLVHGDFSPKNILIGPEGPVVLDAECAWFGDPAFDLAFVLNHLLLKGGWRPQWRDRYADAYTSLAAAYFAHVAWESHASCDTRTAALLPALMLARVDGKSPVEYLSDGEQRDEVRRFARALLASPATGLGEIARRWCAGATR